MIVATKAIITDRDNILILREKAYTQGTNEGKWCLPGGRLHEHESVNDGLMREVLEECGLTVEPQRPVYVGQWFPIIEGVKTHIVGVFFHCVCHGQVKIGDEHDRYQWVAFNDPLLKQLIEPENTAVQTFIKEQKFS